jgi:hypothetical protein
VPEISRFYGIVISMNFRDHPPPHFHATHGGQEMSVEIGTGRVLRGSLSPTARRLVLGWARLHRAELQANWEGLRDPRGIRPPAPIAPLE